MCICVCLCVQPRLTRSRSDLQGSICLLWKKYQPDIVCCRALGGSVSMVLPPASHTHTFTTLKPQQYPTLIWWSVCTEGRWKGWMGIQSPSAHWWLTDSGHLSSTCCSLNSASIYPMLLSDTHRRSHIPLHSHTTQMPLTTDALHFVCHTRIFYAACAQTNHMPHMLPKHPPQNQHAHVCTSEEFRTRKIS